MFLYAENKYAGTTLFPPPILSEPNRSRTYTHTLRNFKTERKEQFSMFCQIKAFLFSTCRPWDTHTRWARVRFNALLLLLSFVGFVFIVRWMLRKRIMFDQVIHLTKHSISCAHTHIEVYRIRGTACRIKIKSFGGLTPLDLRMPKPEKWDVSISIHARTHQVDQNQLNVSLEAADDFNVEHTVSSPANGMNAKNDDFFCHLSLFLQLDGN